MEVRSLSYAQGGPRSALVEEFLRVLEAWFQDSGFSDVEMEITDPAPDAMLDIRDIEAIISFRPRSDTAAALDVLVCGGHGPIAIGINIDSWKRLESRTDLPIRRLRQKPYIAIFREPVQTLTPHATIQVCRAVSNGNIDMHVAIMAGAIVGCWGSVTAIGNDDTWTGPGMGPRVAWLLGKLSLVRAARVSFTPWSRIFQR